MKRVLIAALLVASLVAGATIAEAAVRTGTFKGNIEQGGKISIKVATVNGKKRVTRIAWDGIPSYPCEDDGDGNPADDQTPDDNEGVASGQRIKISSEGRFSVRLQNDPETPSIIVRVTGTYNSSGNKITGIWRQVQRYNLDDELDPAGPTDCASGTRAYSANRQ